VAETQNRPPKENRTSQRKHHSVAQVRVYEVRHITRKLAGHWKQTAGQRLVQLAARTTQRELRGKLKQVESQQDYLERECAHIHQQSSYLP
jgi:hypothetical protein